MNDQRHQERHMHEQYLRYILLNIQKERGIYICLTEYLLIFVRTQIYIQKKCNC